MKTDIWIYSESWEVAKFLGSLDRGKKKEQYLNISDGEVWGIHVDGLLGVGRSLCLKLIPVRAHPLES